MNAAARAGARINAVPLELTNAELATAATACRAMAYQEGKRAKKMESCVGNLPIAEPSG